MKVIDYSRLVFMGTPDFAVPALKMLLENREQVLAVFTQPDRPKGRGRHLAQSPVKETALAHGLPIVQPDSLKDPVVRESLSAYRADLFIVVAYGQILPQDVLDIPAWGSINIHASLLPKFRGAAPIASRTANSLALRANSALAIPCSPVAVTSSASNPSA